MIEGLEIQQRQTYQEISSHRAPVVNGVKLCLNGCGKPVPEGNSKYCSLKCANEYYAKHNQQGIRQYLEEREHGRCQICGWKNPYFEKPRPEFLKPYPVGPPVFSKPRPEEKSFPGYDKFISEHRICHVEYQLIVSDKEVSCSRCGVTIATGKECYCNFPKTEFYSEYCRHNVRCCSDCLKQVDPYRYRNKAGPSSCNPVSLHCVDCGLKEVKEIERSWQSFHRKALVAFKKAYKQWNADYDAWVATGELRAYQEQVSAWSKEQEEWAQTVLKAWEEEKAIYTAGNKNSVCRKFIADHIIPIALGGPEFDLLNLQWLCEECNKPKTAKDAAIIALVRGAINGKRLPLMLEAFLRSEDKPLQERINMYSTLCSAVSEWVPFASTEYITLERFVEAP